MRLGMFSPDIHEFLDAVVRGRKNMLISGGTGAGKSTFLGALAEAIPDRERIVTIEDAAELILDQEHVVRMETRPANVEGRGRITARDLVINALRMRPDRIIVGEVRGGEALDMLQAMNTGHDGSLTTVHANSPRDALARLETMVLMAGLDLPSRAIREQIVSALQFDRPCPPLRGRRAARGERRRDHRPGRDAPQLQEIFRFQRRRDDRLRRGADGIAGEHVATGIVPRMVEESAAARHRRAAEPVSHFGHSSGRIEHFICPMIDSLLLLGLLLVGGAVIVAAMRRLRSIALPTSGWSRLTVANIFRLGRDAAVARSWIGGGPPLGWPDCLSEWAADLVFGLAPIFAAAVCIVVSLLGNQLEIYLSGRKAMRIEGQLADAIDMMIGALGAGAGVMVSLESAVREAREPLRSPLEEMVARIRLGDDPQAVFQGLCKRVPLETFLLFASALAVQWETGGSLAPTLATVGRTIRDRVELSRRIRSNVVQSQLSVIAVLGVTYFLALVIWRSDPERMRQFLATSFGQWSIAASMLLQAFGIVWMSAISRIRF